MSYACGYSSRARGEAMSDEPVVFSGRDFSVVESVWGEWWCEQAALWLRTAVNEEFMLDPQPVTPEAVDKLLTERFGTPDNLPFKGGPSDVE